MTRRADQVHELPPMGAPSPCQRPLSEGGLRALAAWPAELPSVETLEAASEPPPLTLVAEDAATVEGRVVTSVEELEALADEEVFEESDHDGGPAPWMLGQDALDEPLFEGSSSEVHDGGAARTVFLAPSPRPAIDHAERHRHVAWDAADRLLQLTRDRRERPLAERLEGERRMFAQVDALICIGGSSVAELARWHDEVGSPDSGGVLVFVVACLEGREPVEALANRMGRAESWAQVRAMAEAFAASPNPHHAPLARALLARGEDGSVAVALLVLALRGEASAADLLAWVRSGGPLTKAAALRGLTRCPEIQQPPAEVIAELAHDDAAVAWEATRACTRWGSHAAYAELRNGGSLAERLGPKAAEIYVMTGEPDDAERMQRLVSRHPMTPALLDAVARFGLATTWSFLSHYVGDAFLREDAVRALITLFGDVVPEDAQDDPFAWEKAIAALRLDEGRRWRRGRPWSPAWVCEEWAAGTLSARAVEARLDELAGRAGVMTPVALHAWGARPGEELDQVKTKAMDAARSYRAGSWRWR